MKLYTYWRSSAAYRVRIALALKNVPYESAYVHLVRDGGEQLKSEYDAINPQHLVPALELDDATVLTQSMAILEYLEDAYPDQPLLPKDAKAKARVRALCQAVASDMHPLNNLRVLSYLSKTLNIDGDQKSTWYHHWINIGFEGLEQLLARSTDTGEFCHGSTPTLADACLIPQLYNARRFKVDLSPYAHIQRIEAACQDHPAFVAAAPQAQGDATP
ncbi:MAG: maleylacetoacetate isomerase [Magnetovibrio sp.]|nr:maleylacetoacetate isomerase [Magnetovibrio sp.]